MVGVAVRFCTRASTSLVRGEAAHSLSAHQHCLLVRTGESLSPASDRSKCALAEERRSQSVGSRWALVGGAAVARGDRLLPAPCYERVDLLIRQKVGKREHPRQH